MRPSDVPEIRGCHDCGYRSDGLAAGNPLRNPAGRPAGVLARAVGRLRRAMSAIPQSSKQIALEGLVDLAGHYRRQGQDHRLDQRLLRNTARLPHRFLLKASCLGDVFIVGVNSDASVAAVKGPGRPLATEAERLLVLSARVYRLHHRLRPARLRRGAAGAQAGCLRQGTAPPPRYLNERERAVIEESGGCIASSRGPHEVHGLDCGAHPPWIAARPHARPDRRPCA